MQESCAEISLFFFFLFFNKVNFPQKMFEREMKKSIDSKLGCISQYFPALAGMDEFTGVGTH